MLSCSAPSSCCSSSTTSSSRSSCRARSARAFASASVFRGSVAWSGRASRGALSRSDDRREDFLATLRAVYMLVVLLLVWIDCSICRLRLRLLGVSRWDSRRRCVRFGDGAVLRGNVAPDDRFRRRRRARDGFPRIVSIFAARHRSRAPLDHDRVFLRALRLVSDARTVRRDGRRARGLAAKRRQPARNRRRTREPETISRRSCSTRSVGRVG